MEKQCQDFFAVHPRFRSLDESLKRALDLWITSYRSGGKTLLCGNGGSAADCEHIVGELMKSFEKPRPLPPAVQNAFTDQLGAGGAQLAASLHQGLPAISLCSHVSLLTAIGNDMGWKWVYAQQVVGYGRPGDVLLAISTSGTSANVLVAAQTAKVLGLEVLALTGPEPNPLAAAADAALRVPGHGTAGIQENQQILYHFLCRVLEEELFS